MKKMKEIRKKIRKTVGKKGEKFLKDVAMESINSKTFFRLSRSFRKGMKERKRIQEEILREKENEECKKNISEFVVTSSMFTYGSLVVAGMYDKDSPRIKEIELSVEEETEKLLNEVSSGMFEYVYDIDEEIYGPAIDVLTQLIINRLLVAARLTPEETDVFMTLWNEFKKDGY